MLTTNQYAVFGWCKLMACSGILCTILFTASNSLVFAEEVELEEIIVTAQKREQNIIDVPISISALSSKELEARGIEDMRDLAFAVPDLTVIEQFPGINMVFIRGLGGFAGSGSLSGIYLDEYAVTVTNASEMDPRMVDIERAEVLRGPQGTLFGQASMSGTVRLISKAPELDYFGAKGDVSTYLTKDSDELSKRISGVVNIPVVKDVFGLRIAGEYESAGGWADQSVAGREDVNDQDIKNVQLKGLWRPTELLEVKGTLLVNRLDADAGNANINEDRDLQIFVFPDALLPTEINSEIYGLTVTYDFGPVRLLSASSYFEYDQTIFQTAVSGAFGLYTRNKLETEVFTQEIRLNSTGEGALTWTGGFFYRDYKRGNFAPANTRFLGLGAAVIPIPTAIERVEDSNSWAIFGDASYALTDRLELGGGMRYFENDRDINDVVAMQQQESTFDKVTWRTYLSYEFIENIKAYANIATGFRSGGFNTSGAPSYDPDELTSYEVGTKASLLDGRLSIEMALFYSEYDDMQALQINTPNPNGTSNIGEAEIKGIDWSINWRPVDTLTLTLNGNVIDSEITKIKGISNKVVGDTIDFVPEYTYVLSANYGFNWIDDIPGFIRLDYNEQGRMSYTDQQAGQFGKSDKLQFLNARIGAEWKQWNFEVYGKNLLDEDGEISAWGPFFSSPYRTRPATVGIDIGLEF